LWRAKRFGLHTITDLVSLCFALPSFNQVIVADQQQFLLNFPAAHAYGSAQSGAKAIQMLQ
jgi:hypothetical protein